LSQSRIAYHARWVLPIASSAIPDGAIVVEGATIRYVGASSGANADTHVRLGNCLLMPGLVNVHTHLELTAMRGFLDGLDFRKWLGVLTNARNDVLDAGAMLDAATMGIHEGLLAGITTYGDCASSVAPLAAMRATGVRGVGYIETFGPDAATCEDSLRTLQNTVNAERLLDSPLVKVAVSPHAPYTVSAALFRQVADWARAEALQLAVHVSESHAEVAFVRDGTGPFADRLRERGIAVSATGVSPVQLLADTGMLGASTLLIHGVQMDDTDVRLAAESGSAVAHCPVSNAKLGHGMAPLDLFLQNGLRVGLGSDSVASNNRMDVLLEARFATLMQSIRQGVPDALSARRALSLATLEGAEALGLRAVTGSLEVGKQADLAAFPLDRIEATTVFEAEDMLVHALAGAVQARLVLVAGRERVRDGRVVGAVEGLADRMRTIARQLKGWRTA
jgi:cytosine/adenosine deaminase-related metal-dependent hydrolase